MYTNPIILFFLNGGLNNYLHVELSKMGRPPQAVLKDIPHKLNDPLAWFIKHTKSKISKFELPGVGTYEGQDLTIS